MNARASRAWVGWILGGLLAAAPWVHAAPAGRVAITMQLDWKPNVQFAGLLLAKERGYYAEAGLDVTIRPVDVEMRVAEDVAGRTNWIGCSESGVLLGARAKGLPIRAFGTMFQGSPFCLMSLRTNGITEPRHLVGRRVGVHPDANLALDVVLANAGVPRSQLICKDVAHSIQPLITGEVDVLMGYLIDEAVALKQAGYPLNVIAGYDHGYVAYSQVYFTSEAFLERDPETLRRFLEASNRGWREAFRATEATAKWVVQRYLPDADLGYQVRSLEKIAGISVRETGVEFLGRMNPDRWSEMCQVFERAKALPRIVTPQEMTDYRILEALYPARKPTWVNSLGQGFLPVPGTRVLMSVWETRVRDYRAFVQATGHAAEGGMMTLGPDDVDWAVQGGTWQSPGFPQSDDSPVVGVSWRDAEAYCAWLTTRERQNGRIGRRQSYRLPKDQEWSAAAGLEVEAGRTPETRMARSGEKYPWGRTWPPPAGYGNYAGLESAAGKPSWWGTIPGSYRDAFPRTAPVGSFPVNRHGFHDLSGNVWEWCADEYLPGSLARVARGGCWGSDRPAYLLLARRQNLLPESRNDETGFRVVLTGATP
jgi:formylglycine-generating enzyme required for sulfatase activity/ABC-type nitrate/sulfonate/bicarbonate transport system substrate-binding protein